MISAPDKILPRTEASQSGLLSGSFAENYPLNILVAEDNFINQKLIERILHKLGYQIDVASDGVEALNSFISKKYDVILMDVRMPEMDGFETTRIIRQMTGNQPFIIAMTANVTSSDREECFQNGMNDFIPKPLSLNDVVNKLKTATEYSSGRK